MAGKAGKAGKKQEQRGAGSKGKWVGIAVAVLAVAVGVVYKLQGERLLDLIIEPRDLKPLKAPRLTQLPELLDRAYQQQMLWGSYRSGLYFGMRMRLPKSLLTGLMWFDPDNVMTLRQQKVRHTATEDDHLGTYGWVRHDGASFGRQVLLDEEYNLTLSMVKTAGEGSGVGGDWSVRISASRLEWGAPPPASGRPKRISLVMYIGDEETPSTPWQVLPQGEPSPEELRDGALLVTGDHSAVGRWSLHARHAQAEVPDRRSKGARLDYLAMPVEKVEYLLYVKQLMMNVMLDRLDRNPSTDAFRLYLPNGASTGSNLALFQVTLNLPGTVDFTFLSHKPGVDPQLAQDPRVEELTGEPLGALLAAKEAEFDARFDQVFPAWSPAGGSASVDEDEDEDEEYGGWGRPSPELSREAAKAALSNLLGSMGYFYGSSQVRVRRSPSAPPELRQSRPAALFTAVPSRSFFPRGFLWDEGFHQLLVQRWDGRLSRDALAHWLDLLNVNGWIPREQILGEEARMRVQDQFVVQDPSNANPPSLFLPILTMARRLQEAHGGGEDAQRELAAERDFLRAAWPRLRAWYNFFNTTQAGPVPGSFRWHGRNSTTQFELNPKTLTSGLDDYPRASHPSDDERHLDLRCWMAMASQAMSIIGRALGLPEQATRPYDAAFETLASLEGLDALHLDRETGQYLDYGRHTEDAALARRTFKVGGATQEVTYRVVNSPPSLRLVPAFGYVSLFPLALQLLPPGSKSLSRQLELLRSEKLLWTRHGLRSLAPTSSLYKKYNTETDPPYWRGQIWININYLVLNALHAYASAPEAPTAATEALGLPASAAGGHDGSSAEEAAARWQEQRQLAGQLHAQLRRNVVATVTRQYGARGYLFEQYDDRNGMGLSSHPFTGWTALVALLA